MVRFIVTTTGDAEYFGEGVAGSITSEYLLSEINGQPDVVLPLVCLDGVLDIPLLQASNLVRAARDALSYQTEVSVTDAVDFYLEGMPDEGWTLLGETTVGAFVILRFSRDDRGLFVIVSDDAGVTRIDAVLGSLPSL